MSVSATRVNAFLTPYESLGGPGGLEIYLCGVVACICAFFERVGCGRGYNFPFQTPRALPAVRVLIILRSESVPGVAVGIRGKPVAFYSDSHCVGCTAANSPVGIFPAHLPKNVSKRLRSSSV